MPSVREPEEKRRYMLDTPMPRLIPAMALPTIAGMMVTTAYNLADTFFVSRLGTYATGAVGINASIDNIIMMAGALMATGAASYTARLLGAREDRHAKEVFATCYYAALALGVLVLIFGSIFTDPLLRLLGASDAIMPYSRQYARYILLAAPFMATNFVLNQCLRAEGSAIYSMIGMVSGAVLNIGLDPIFIFTFGWGVAGASAATAISKVVSWIILMAPYFRRKTLLTPNPAFFRPRKGDVVEVCTMGSASFFRNGLSTLAALVLNRLAVGFGESALAAISVANRITMFMTSACLGFGQGFQPVAGFSWGAGRYDRVRSSYRFSQWTCVLGISVFAGLMALFARPILLCFTEDDAELVRIGVTSLRLQCLAMPAHGFCIIVNMLCAGIGKGRYAAILGLSRQGIFFFPILWPMVRLFGVWGVASVQAVADIISLGSALPIAVKVLREVDQLEAAQSSSLPEAPKV